MIAKMNNNHFEIIAQNAVGSFNNTEYIVIVTYVTGASQRQFPKLQMVDQKNCMSWSLEYSCMITPCRGMQAV